MDVGTTRKSIQQLSQGVINKIAAGEVIERPSSVVKELVENSIDAGATQLTVTIEQGGADLIRVVDNGHGIPADELMLAIASHATSKIRGADDLFSVDTMGFRGEALASISEVSEFRLRSRVAGSDAGAEIEVLGGSPGPVEPCGCSVGTTIEVRRLFFNTPVRRKFMRTPQTEMSHITEAIIRIALAHPAVRFSLQHGQRQTLELPPVQDMRQRIAHCFGGELTQDLIWVQSQDEVAKIYGYVANPQHSRSSNKHQYLFLNGRHIRDRSLQHALTEAYRGILLTGRHPIAFLNLEMSPQLVDVNVHPTKLEVRFQDSGRLYKQLLGMLRNRFLTTDLTATFRPELPADADADMRFEAPHALAAPHFPVEERTAGAGNDPYGATRDDILRWARGGQPSSGRAVSGPGSGMQQPAGPLPRDAYGAGQFALRPPTSERQTSLPLTTDEPPSSNLASLGTWRSRNEAENVPAPSVAHDSAFHERSTPTTAVGSTHAMQVHNRYLVTASEDGIIVIDQHALHERVLYEQLREKVLQKEVEKQRLLVPEPVPLMPTEASAILQSRELLSDLGIEVEEFGGDTVLVSSYPAMLANFNPAELIRQLAEQLVSGSKLPDPRDLLDELLHMISCKAAIKAGDRLAVEEIDALIAQRHLVQDSHHCPHGRPTTLIFTQKELDHRFQRI